MNARLPDDYQYTPWSEEDEQLIKRREQYMRELRTSDKLKHPKQLGDPKPMHPASPHETSLPKKRPMPERDDTGKWTTPPKYTPQSYRTVNEEVLTDWRVLLRDLSVRTISVMDVENGQVDTYYRRQKTGEDELLWYSFRDMLEPEGHTIEQMAEMWDRFSVATRYTPGFEPPHTHVGATSGGCPPCIEMAKVMAGEKNKK